MINLKKITVGALAAAALIAGTLVPSFAAGGKLVIKGSDTVLPLAQRWAETYMEKNPNAMVSVTGGGSGVGLTALISGTCDIADASREISEKEIAEAKSRGILPKVTRVARDGISIVVNPRNNVKNLTLEQLKDIYTGKITSWSQVGGHGGKIITTGRDTSSGTYVFFMEFILKKQKYYSGMMSLPSNNAICQTVANDENAIGYVGLAYADKFESKGKVKVLSISRKTGEPGIVPSFETVKSEKYPIFRYLYNYTRGAASGLAKDYLGFVLSKEGQEIVTQIGYVPVR